MFKLGQFRENGEFIDVRLKVDKSIFPAHRNVLAANSDYFHAMFTNGMKESNQEMGGRVEKTDPHSADYPLTPLRGLLYGLVRGLPCGLP